MSHPIILLGPQRSGEHLRAELDRLGVDGPLCAITAGWRHDEGELDELRDLGAIDLALYRRTEAAFDADPALFRAHRERQTRLQELQRFYRLRLRHAAAALRELDGISDDQQLLTTQRRAALAALRLLDRQHLKLVGGAHAAFAERFAPARTPVLAAERERLAQRLRASAAVLIAGGHVGLLVARMRLFDLGPLLTERPLLAWSAGAMALTERVVAFHDAPPQGPNDPQLIDVGFGLAPSLVALPHAHRRLRLDDAARQSAFAARFAPARCVTLDADSRVRLERGRVVAARAHTLTRTGRLAPLAV